MVFKKHINRTSSRTHVPRNGIDKEPRNVPHFLRVQAGVVLYICLCGFEPFFGVTEKDVIAANKEAVFEFPPEAWDDVSEGAKDLIRQMMEPDPARRITPHEALRHSWIVQHRTSLH
ncbi:conserved unknown protein [Ectocarpus siliculosus]|uniref:Protein kinase domain-containing protein n=1 Tax=Ectocarpus siliculosus TaxID=2880 RepID=D7FZP0_ECTSI|nr:conserved unknown protein [Ectocarpus siliculosus]|eukprot:CBJ32847.1 conserved unknown protein [Ectocarpus siliculosus]